MVCVIQPPQRNVLDFTANKIIGCGPRLSNEVSLIIERTITMMEHDMGHKDGNVSVLHHAQTPIIPNHIKQESYDSVPSHHQQLPHTPNGIESNPMDSSAGARVAPAENAGFYDTSIAAAAASYPHISYTDQGPVQAPNGTNAMQGYAPADSTQYLYAATAAAAAAAAATTAGSAHQAASNPLVAFASQATQHVSHPHQAGDEWARAMAGQNTWHDWTAAMADSQDRYSANALLTLGNGQQQQQQQRGDGAGGELGVDGAVAASNHAGQWPMLIFHDGGGSVSGG